MTVTVPGQLLFADPTDGLLLISFDCPACGLTPNQPCYLPSHAVHYQLFDQETGEILASPIRNDIGYALFTMQDPLWANAPQLVATLIRERERLEKADWRDRKAKANADKARRRMLTPKEADKIKARRAKAQRDRNKRRANGSANDLFSRFAELDIDEP